MASAFILVYGNPIDGHRFVGPFDDREAAIRYMDGERHSENIWIAELDAPANNEGENADG
jgi:phosphatidylserine decarboxylase